MNTWAEHIIAPSRLGRRTLVFTPPRLLKEFITLVVIVGLCIPGSSSSGLGAYGPATQYTYAPAHLLASNPGTLKPRIGRAVERSDLPAAAAQSLLGALLLRPRQDSGVCAAGFQACDGGANQSGTCCPADGECCESINGAFYLLLRMFLFY